MKRIVNSEEMKFCDSNTIHHFGVPSLVLMERAALLVTEETVKAAPDTGRVLIVCGNGNNGADGLAVARLLYQRGYAIVVVQTPDNGKRSLENQLQRDILGKYGIKITEQMPQSFSFDCVIDALFGVGLTRALTGIYAQWIQLLNQTDSFRIAIDMPSGVSADDGTTYEPSFAAHLTVTFAYQKAGQLFYPGCETCGKVVIADIGITDESWLGRRPGLFAPEPSDLLRIPKRPARSNKGTFGRVLVIAGSMGMAGAALFCAKAAYACGCGLVKIVTCEENRSIIQTSLPEAILSVYQTQDSEQMREDLLAEAIRWADVIAIGPGLGTAPAACKMTRQVLLTAKTPVIADADALRILADQPDLLRQSSASLIVTPHPGEMAGLCKKKIPDILKDLRGVAVQFAAQYDLICVLKDAVTVTAGPSGTYLNTSGCSAMAKGGSGDILTGMIAALAAQGMELQEAAYIGVYLHGLAGEAAAEQTGSYSVLAGDLLHAIGTVFHKYLA